MKRVILNFILILSIFGCSKEEAPETTTNKDYASFLAQTNMSFRGKLNDNYFSWNFGVNQFSATRGHDTDAIRIVDFGLNSINHPKIWFLLYSPTYNVASETEVSKVFSIGKKKLGDLSSNFHLQIYTNNNLYESSNLNTASEIEILKAQEFTYFSGQTVLRVWYRIDATLSSSSSSVALTDGLLFAEYSGYKK